MDKKAGIGTTRSTSTTPKHKTVNHAIHKTTTKIIEYNDKLTLSPMPKNLSTKFLKFYYAFLFVNQINNTEAILASYIYTFYEHTKMVFIKPTTIGRNLNIPRSNVYKYIAHLLELEIIGEQTQGNDTLYVPLLDPQDLTRCAQGINEDDGDYEEDIEDEDIEDEEDIEKEVKEIKKVVKTITKPTPSQPKPTSQSIPTTTTQPTSAPNPKPKLPPLPSEIQAQLASDNFDMIYYDIPPYYNPNKIDELNLRPYNLRFGIYTYPKPGDSNFDVSDRTSPYYDPEDDPDNDAYWDWSDDIPVPKKKARQTQQIQQAQAKTTTTATTTTKLDSKTDTIKPAASASNNTAYWR